MTPFPPSAPWSIASDPTDGVSLIRPVGLVIVLRLTD